MAFNFDIPHAGDVPSISQGEILDNFVALGTIAGNGTPGSNCLDTVIGFRFIRFSDRANSPPNVAQFPVNVSGLYSHIHATTGFSEIYINKPIAGGLAIQVPMTATQTRGNPNYDGWTYLPSGVKMVWGFGTMNGVSSLVVNYNSVTGFPGFTNLSATPIVTRYAGGATSAASFVFVSAYTQTSFTVHRSVNGTSGNVDFTWMAIGA